MACYVLFGSSGLLVSVLAVDLVQDHICTVVFISCDGSVLKWATCNA